MPFQDNDQPAARVCIGKITDAHGLRGLVKVLIFDVDPALLKGEIYISENGEDTLTLTLKNPNGKYYLVAVDGITDRNGAEALKGTALYIESASLPQIDQEKRALIGLPVFDHVGQEIGKVLSVQNFGASDLLEIKPKGGESYYIPLTEDFVPEIDLDNGRVIIRPMEMI